MPLPHMHSPATHRSALGVHIVWHVPQLSKSVCVSTHPPEQQVSPAAHGPTPASVEQSHSPV